MTQWISSSDFERQPEDVRDLEASNAILCPYQEFQTRYEVATAETPSTARRRVFGRADAAGRDKVWRDREEALASVRNILARAGIRDGGRGGCGRGTR